MVGVPGRSKACSTCRERKISVSDSHYPCTGYTVGERRDTVSVNSKSTLVRRGETTMQSLCEIRTGMWRLPAAPSVRQSVS